MAVTSVKLTEAGKESLDQLQARLLLLGHKMTKEHILELVLRAASRKVGDILVEDQGGPVVVSEMEAQKIIKRLVDPRGWGRTSWKDIDEILYGWRKQR